MSHGIDRLAMDTLKRGNIDIAPQPRATALRQGLRETGTGIETEKE